MRGKSVLPTCWECELEQSPGREWTVGRGVKGNLLANSGLQVWPRATEWRHCTREHSKGGDDGEQAEPGK